MFNWNDVQQGEAIGWLVLFVGIMLAAVAGCILHGVTREYRQYVKWRKTHAAWKQICESEGK